MTTNSMQALLTHQHVLLLQGKMGSFFHRFASFLHTQNLQVSKVNFNAGDACFYRHKPVYAYTGTETEFKDWLANLLINQDIDAVVCFGDCRSYHWQASQLCQEMGRSFFVFEEGYLRPDYITFEAHGINANSQLDINLVHRLPKAKDKPIYTNNRFYRLIIAAILYYTLTWLGRWRYPHYYHYRGMNIWQEAAAWLKAPWRKLLGYHHDKRLQKNLITNHHHAYFLVSLQVYNDSQITHHSDYQDVKEFIAEVMISFAKHANVNHSLVFKHHPLDRGHRHYRSLINQLADEHQITGRVFYGCDMHLPTLIQYSLGMVTVNSTTGLQSIYHQKPTKLMGRAIYNVHKLTDQQPLNAFWQQPTPPDRDFYLRFREYLIEENQLNGSFYGRSPWMNAYVNQSQQTSQSDKTQTKR